MFDSSSRYADDRVHTNIFVTRDGRKIPYKQRRFVPAPGNVQTVGEVEILPVDRLDLVTYRALGDPLQFWRICDANGISNPFSQELRPGETLSVPGSPD